MIDDQHCCKHLGHRLVYLWPSDGLNLAHTQHECQLLLPHSNQFIANCRPTSGGALGQTRAEEPAVVTFQLFDLLIVVYIHSRASDSMIFNMFNVVLTTVSRVMLMLRAASLNSSDFRSVLSARRDTADPRTFLFSFLVSKVLKIFSRAAACENSVFCRK